MISKYRNRALLQIVIAIVLSVLLVVVFRKSIHTFVNKNNWTALGVILYVASYAMWVMASLSLARARGYQRDAMGVLFAVCFIIGFCIPILPLLFPFFIIFGLEDKTKDKMRRR
jgi:cytochrome c oxidase assembly factor CtaG